MITKIKNWFMATGLENFGYAAAAIGSFILVGGGVGTFLAGGFTGLFIYFNYDKIKELVNKID
jgi:hypothetical protein|tara:strand:- start:1184 stop:1372 length:189 start_codon:yes stop_codon:yes gene_type:complete